VQSASNFNCNLGNFDAPTMDIDAVRTKAGELAEPEPPIRPDQDKGAIARVD